MVPSIRLSHLEANENGRGQCGSDRPSSLRENYRPGQEAVTASQIGKRQFAGMNQHYRKFPLDYFLDAQQRVGFQNIELWLGVPHFWLDSVSYDDCKVVRKKVKDRGLQVVSVTSPSMAYQYQYSPREESHRERSFKYFSNGIKVAAELGAGIMTVNSGWGYLNGDAREAFERAKDMISRLCDVAAAQGGSRSSARTLSTCISSTAIAAPALTSSGATEPTPCRRSCSAFATLATRVGSCRRSTTRGISGIPFRQIWRTCAASPGVCGTRTFIIREEG
jgi:hypothetical protein